jgi:small subunit ribosomal protein S17
MTGIVTSNKMEKALVIAVYSLKSHSKYQKRYKARKKFVASCSDSKKFAIGQSVVIESCRPVSKTISWKVSEIQN